MPKTVIIGEHVTKYYDLGVIGTGTLSRDLNRWWAGMRHQSDPEAKIGLQLRDSAGRDSIMALDDVSFSVDRGETLGIIGRNGAGKSTLLKILSRVTAPTRGQVKIKGRVGSLLEVGTGFHPELTGRENVFLNGAILGMKKAEVRRKFDEIVAFSGVEKFIDTPVKRYSSGMYVRLAFAVAAHLEPEILIVDEVLAVGDAEFQKKCLGKMGDMAEEGRTVLFVSHNMGAINNLCQRCLLLEAGRISRTGFPKDVVSHYLKLAEGNTGSEVTFAPIDSEAYFMRIALLDEKSNPNLSLQVTSSFKIHFEYQVVKPIAYLEVAFSLFDSQNSVVFYSGVSKDKKNHCMEHGIGHYVAEVQIPANFLVPGTYNITAGLHRPNMQLFDRRDHVVKFAILETGSIDYRYSGQDIGSIFVDFDWTVERVENKLHLS